MSNKMISYSEKTGKLRFHLSDSVAVLSADGVLTWTNTNMKLASYLAFFM